MKSTLTLIKTDTVNPNARTIAPRTAPARSRRSPAGQWDMLAVIGLMVCSAAYSICAITQMTGF